MKFVIKEIAKKKGVSMLELANRIGITPPSMSNIVNGKLTPSLETLEKIADALDVPIGELFGQTDKSICCPVCGSKVKLEE